MAFAAGDYTRARELWARALPIVEQLGEPREIARALGELGACSCRGRPTCAIPLYDASLEKLANTDDRHGIGIMLANLAAAYEGLGEVKARTASLEALQLQEEIGDEDGIAISNLNMASLEAAAGELDAAGRHLARRSTRRSASATARDGLRDRDRGRDRSGARRGRGCGPALRCVRGAVPRPSSAPQAEEAERVRRVQERIADRIDLEAPGTRPATDARRVRGARPCGGR